MEESKLAKILNQIIITAFISAIIFIYAQHFLKNLYLSIPLTAAIALIITTETNFFRKKKTNRLNFEKEDLKFKDDIIWYFLTQPTNNVLDFFQTAINKLGIKTEIKNNAIITKNAIIVPIFNSFIVGDKEILSLIKELKAQNKKHLIIFCADYKELNLPQMSETTISILNSYETFAFLKSIKTYPIEKTQLVKKHEHLIFSKSHRLTRNHFKPFFMGSIFLFITSFLVPQKMYYIMIASILLAISLICLIAFKKQTTKQKYEQAMNQIKQ